MRICAISDLHYKYHITSKTDQENQQIILSFLDSIKGRYDLLVLAGDIFDLWFDGRYTVVKQYFPLLVRLHEIHRQGCRIVLISGNHDFWFGDFLPDTIGMELYPESFRITADGRKMLFCHGDTHTVNDTRYRILRWTLRLPITRKLFSLIHPDLALSLGSLMSRSSRERKLHPEVRSRKNEGLKSFATRQIKQGSSEIVVMGHSHEPQVSHIDSGVYANCGDWLGHYSYIEILGGEVYLRSFKVTDSPGSGQKPSSE